MEGVNNNSKNKKEKPRVLLIRVFGYMLIIQEMKRERPLELKAASLEKIFKMVNINT
jgi:hypothetical protein